ncbi:hypothetical protein C0Q70_16796 [Pomacea canaliculata]|uniref:Uncharacterized protein n=1 Tax=Pomacea canaliculata TaxID=400727 RepID=A0A2T7NQS3_POMCA|nr:hypothetical protein C0Q70_16796 [Pomacea canaliculata]
MSRGVDETAAQAQLEIMVNVGMLSQTKGCLPVLSPFSHQTFLRNSIDSTAVIISYPTTPHTTTHTRS